MSLFQSTPLYDVTQQFPMSPVQDSSPIVTLSVLYNKAERIIGLLLCLTNVYRYRSVYVHTFYCAEATVLFLCVLSAVILPRYTDLVCMCV